VFATDIVYLKITNRSFKFKSFTLSDKGEKEMVMYNSKIISCIKVDGKILREFGDTVKIPYGSEYSIFLKNLNSLKAIVHITIDGKEVVENGLILDYNSSIDLERFVNSKNMEKGNRFKFIERTKSIEDHRGIGAEDGIVHISYEFAKPAPKVVYEDVYVKRRYYNKPYYNDWGFPYNGDIHFSDLIGEVYNGVEGKSMMGGVGGTSSASMNYASNSFRGLVSSEFNDSGITVAGDISNQSFKTVSGFETDGVTHVMILKLCGANPNEKVEFPVTVKTKQQCTTCNKSNKATSKYCSSCGTALEIL
jgi:hypothetical protein